MRAHSAVCVLPDHAWMPSPLVVVGKLDAVTGPFAYLRLLGDRDEVDKQTKTHNKTVVDRTAQIQADAEAIRLLAARVPMLAFVNNHYAGYAPKTVQELRAALGHGSGGA